MPAEASTKKTGNASDTEVIGWRRVNHHHPDPLTGCDLSIPFENTYFRELEGLYRSWKGDSVPDPNILIFNQGLADELGLPPALHSRAGARLLCGMTVPEGVTPLAQAYAGHQFGNFVPQLGDGRALLLGELVDSEGRRRDLHLKGSGATPFSRGGDGKAGLGPMLREFAISEALHALGVPTTRSLAVVTTGERIARQNGPEPGAVLARVAASHIRVGTFQYAAVHHGPRMVRRLADYAIARHDPELREREGRHLLFLERVIERQVRLVARWMQVGFIHGVMNTDNMTVSGETIDYGPCAFMDAYHPATVFSSIDHQGRYAYGNQPRILQWNLARFAETLIPLLDDDEERALELATERIQAVPTRFARVWLEGMRLKLGMESAEEGDRRLVEGLLALLREQGVDFTLAFRRLGDAAAGDPRGFQELFSDPAVTVPWLERWRARLARDSLPDHRRRDRMMRVNPLYIPRNHKVEEALRSSVERGDPGPLERLLQAVVSPFEEKPGMDDFARPAPPEFNASYRTFCGT